MVQITRVEATHDYVVMEYLTNGITISTRVMEDQERTPQEILDKGYAQLKPHIQMECDRRGIEANHDLPIAVDEVISIALVGIENVSFVEGQTPIQKSFRCAGKTLYGKTLDLSDVAVFTPSKDMSIEPTESGVVEVSVHFEKLTDTRSFQVSYKSLADIQAEVDAQKELTVDIPNPRISEINTRMQEIRTELLEGDWKTVKYVEGVLSEEDFAIHKNERQSLRDEYNLIEIELDVLTAVQGE